MENKKEEYIKVFKEIYKDLEDMKLTAKNRLEVSISILQELGKDSRTPDYEQEKKDWKNEPATQKQIDLLKSLGAKTIPEDITKVEAGKLIEMNLTRQKENKQEREKEY